jgi:glutamate 5-kinase
MQYLFEDDGLREDRLKSVKRVVIKVGTRLLMDVPGESPEERVQKLIAEVAKLRNSGLEVVLVSSGAIGAALRVLKTTRRPKRMAALQAYAALGQCHLMTLYEEACNPHGFHCAQLLLTAADLHDRDRNLKVTQCLEELLAQGLLPVINENDSVCTDEIKVGDNDTLAALASSLCRADLTILLTTIDGLRERDPKTGELGRRISVVNEIGAEVLAQAQGTDGNSFSVGGMITKLRAAGITTSCGEYLWIADGFDFGDLKKIFAFEDIGTLFVPPHRERMHARQRFIAFFSEPAGELIIDAGAEDALLHKGKSLLPSGVLGLKGVFSPGATVRITNASRKELARGTVNFGTADLSKICGAGTAQLENLLGYKPAATEVVHRNALVITTFF